MGLMDSINNNINYVVNLVWVPAILVSAILSVLMADMHREIKGTITYFERKMGKVGRFFDGIFEVGLAFFYAIFVTGLIIFIGIILYTLLIKLIALLPSL